MKEKVTVTVSSAVNDAMRKKILSRGGKYDQSRSIFNPDGTVTFSVDQYLYKRLVQHSKYNDPELVLRDLLGLPISN